MKQIISDKTVKAPLLCIKFFITKIFQNTDGFLYDLFRHCETKKFRRKNVIPALLSMKFFPYQNISETQVSIYNFFRHCKTKTFRRRNVIPAFFSKKFFHTRIFLKHKCPPTIFFDNVKQIISDKTVKAPPPMQKIFHNQNISKHRRLPRRFFWHCETKKIRRNIAIP